MGVAIVVAAGLAICVSPAVGNPHDASDFFIFSRAELGQFAESDCNGSNDKQVDVSGSNNEYHGRIHSHADLAVSGTSNRFSAALTYGTHDEDCQLQAEPQASPGGYLGGEPTDVDAPPRGLDKYGWPGGLGSYLDPANLAGTPAHRVSFDSVEQALPGETCDVGSLAGSGVLTLSPANNGQVVCNGTGKVQLAASGASAQNPLELSITILSHGTIEISGQNVRLSPAAHNILAMTDQPSSVNDVSVKLSGSNLDVPELAILFSPRSGQDVSGSDGSDMCIQLIGQGRVKSSGSNSRFGPHLCRLPARESVLPLAPPGTFTLDQSFPGVAVTVQTNGGLWPSQVSIEPARAYMGGRMASSFAGPAFDIDLPENAPPIQGATLTLPYQEHRLGGASEGDLRIYTFDEDTQFWTKVPGTQTVDAGSNTVTANVTHFSVYAVLKGRTSLEWAQIFGNTPVRCVGPDPGEDVGIDVVFLVDSSGSMGGNDPQGKRVEGAKLFVDNMRDTLDRAAVVDFDSTARRLIDLTALDTQARRDAVKAALDQTNNASGGTDISAAVQQAIAVLSANGGGGRLRVAILLTDGQSSYNTALTAQAAEQAIEIHTVGLGFGVNATLLQNIADGTGGSYRFLANPDELPALYEDLAGDIIGDDTDTDGDTLTDCIEEHGIFVPVSATFPVSHPVPDFPSFITTEPDAADSDGDSLPDSGPGGELEKKSFFDNPILAVEYSFLIDAGLTHFYVMHSDPNDPDTDGDGRNDDLERANGTDPLVFENELGIDGLDLPPFTLFQPERYLPAMPVIERAFLEEFFNQVTGEIEPVTFNDQPVVYDDFRNCVLNCTAVQALAEERPNNEGGWDWCFGGIGFCDSDESQVRDIVEEARVNQGVFDRAGRLDEQFLRLNIVLVCSSWYEDADGDPSNGHEPCGDVRDLVFGGDRHAGDFPDYVIAGAGSIAAPRPGEIPIPNTKTLRRVAAGLIAVTVGLTTIVGEEELANGLRDCFESPALDEYGKLVVAGEAPALPFGAHPCEMLPMYVPGGPNQVHSATHRREAIFGNLDDGIVGNPGNVLQRWLPQPQRPNPNWKDNQPGCTGQDRAAAAQKYGTTNLACDEFPELSMRKGGPPAKLPGSPVGTSLRYLPFGDNSSEGGTFGTFATRIRPYCKQEVEIDQKWFLVIPVPEAPKWIHHCGREG